VEAAPHVAIDLARIRGPGKRACREPWLRASLGREIALVGDTDEAVTEAERKDDLGCAR
jgi:hypothetical protein